MKKDLKIFFSFLSKKKHQGWIKASLVSCHKTEMCRIAHASSYFITDDEVSEFAERLKVCSEENPESVSVWCKIGTRYGSEML